MTGRATGGLDQRGVVAQKALLVGIENADERNLRKIEPLAQQVDADQNVKGTGSQLAQDLHPFDGIHIGMDVAHFQSGVFQVVGQILCGFFRQRGHQRALADEHALTTEFDGFIDLSFQRPQVNQGIE